MDRLLLALPRITSTYAQPLHKGAGLWLVHGGSGGEGRGEQHRVKGGPAAAAACGALRGGGRRAAEVCGGASRADWCADLTHAAVTICLCRGCPVLDSGNAGSNLLKRAPVRRYELRHPSRAHVKWSANVTHPVRPTHILRERRHWNVLTLTTSQNLAGTSF